MRDQSLPSGGACGARTDGGEASTPIAENQQTLGAELPAAHVRNALQLVNVLETPDATADEVAAIAKAIRRRLHLALDELERAPVTFPGVELEEHDYPCHESWACPKCSAIRARNLVARFHDGLEPRPVAAP